jgi:hypothetical protein
MLRRPSRGHLFGRAFAQMVLTALIIRCRRAVPSSTGLIAVRFPLVNGLMAGQNCPPAAP